MDVIPHLPADLDAGYLLVQHMPAGFTKSLAERLNSASALDVREGATGDRIGPGTALMAPGGQHMLVDSSGVVELTSAAPLHGVRPAVDLTLEAAAAAFGSHTVGVILTGMGVDGTRGCKAVKGARGLVAAQDEGTCAVYGMPRSVVEAGFADTVVPITRMAGEIVRLCALETWREAAGIAR
jgi:two-component system chemotaxis response regulator CheB